MKVVRKGGEELGLVGVVEIHYIYTVYNFGPYLGLFLSILSAVDHKRLKYKTFAPKNFPAQIDQTTKTSPHLLTTALNNNNIDRNSHKLQYIF